MGDQCCKSIFMEVDMAQQMGSDVIRSIADCGMEVVFKMALVCKDWRETVKKIPNPIRDAILNLKDINTVPNMAEALFLPPKEVRRQLDYYWNRPPNHRHNLFKHYVGFSLPCSKRMEDGME